MHRREYLQRIGASAAVGITALSGCGTPGDGAAATPGDAGAPGEPTGTSSPAEDGNQTATDGTNQTAMSGENGTANGTGGQSAPTEIAMITAGNDYVFDPIGVAVEPGATVTWVNQSGSHSTTSYTPENPQAEVDRIPDGAMGWNSQILSELTEQFRFTFDVEGTYDYYCIPHKTLGMVGRLVVGEPSGLTGNPPDGPVPSAQRIVEEGAVTQAQFDP